MRHGYAPSATYIRHQTASQQVDTSKPILRIKDRFEDPLQLVWRWLFQHGFRGPSGCQPAKLGSRRQLLSFSFLKCCAAGSSEILERMVTVFSGGGAGRIRTMHLQVVALQTCLEQDLRTGLDQTRWKARVNGFAPHASESYRMGECWMSDATGSIDCWYNWVDALKSSRNFLPSTLRGIALIRCMLA